MWQWAKDDWDKIDEAFHSDLLRMLVPVILGGLSTEDQLKDVTSFFEGRDTSLYSHILKQEVEKISARQKWAERDESDLAQWLVSQGYLEDQPHERAPDRLVDGKLAARGAAKSQGKGHLKGDIKTDPGNVSVDEDTRAIDCWYHQKDCVSDLAICERA